jgi:hypothetical protein
VLEDFQQRVDSPEVAEATLRETAGSAMTTASADVTEGGR